MLFYQLRSQALQIVDEYNLECLDISRGKTLTCASVQNKEHKATGVVLTPQNEGELAPVTKDSIQNLLNQGAVYDINKRSIALALINAIGQWRFQKELPICLPNLRIALSEHIHKLTCKDSKIVFIGHLKPVVNALHQNERNPIVFCRQQTDIQNRVYNDIYEYEGVMDADVVVITGAALIGSTIDAILAMCSKSAHIILAGFSAGLYPRWLRDSPIAEVASINLSNVPLEMLLNYGIEDIFAHPCYIQPTKS